MKNQLATTEENPARPIAVCVGDANESSAFISLRGTSDDIAILQRVTLASHPDIPQEHASNLLTDEQWQRLVNRVGALSELEASLGELVRGIRGEFSSSQPLCERADEAASVLRRLDESFAATMVVAARSHQCPDFDPHTADEEGWGVFDVDTNPTIQRLDCGALTPEGEETGVVMFDSDDEALSWVVSRALAGSRFHQVALEWAGITVVGETLDFDYRPNAAYDKAFAGGCGCTPCDGCAAETPSDDDGSCKICGGAKRNR